jgi:hypothetical protein
VSTPVGARVSQRGWQTLIFRSAQTGIGTTHRLQAAFFQFTGASELLCAAIMIMARRMRRAGLCRRLALPRWAAICTGAEKPARAALTN